MPATVRPLPRTDPTEDGRQERVPHGRGSSEHGPSEHGRYEHGPLEHGPFEHGPLEHGPLESVPDVPTHRTTPRVQAGPPHLALVRGGRELPTRSALRLTLVSTPQPAPDDERVTVRPRVAGRVSPRPSHRPGPRPLLDHPSPAPGAPVDFGHQLTGRDQLPDPRDAGRRLVTAAVEALAGLRPVAQLAAVTSPAVLTALSSGRRPAWCRASRAPLVVGPVRVCEPVDGVAEVSAVARRAGRAHAVAARLEGIDGRWRCTALQIG